MENQIPEIVRDLGIFLEAQGLHRCIGPEAPSFGREFLTYESDAIHVQFTHCDIPHSILYYGGNWGIHISDPQYTEESATARRHTPARPVWYEFPELREWLDGPGEDHLPLDQQAALVKSLWPRIVAAFAPGNRDATHAKLRLLKQEYARRVNKIVDDAELQRIAAFEAFLRQKGLSCQYRAGPDSQPFGNQIIKYGNGTIRVEMVLDRSIWQVEIADALTPNRWCDVIIFRDLLLGPSNDAMAYPQQISFVEANWTAIIGLFDPAHSAQTRARLDELKKERARRFMAKLDPSGSFSDRKPTACP